MRSTGALTTAVCGHFGELLQGRLGPAGPVVVITLPCPALRLRGWYSPGGDLRVHSPERLVWRAQARRFLALVGGRPRGRFALRPEMPAGGGAGASTAALVALARLAAPDCPPLELARACVTAEGASDPLMFPAPERILWASREAEIAGHMPILPRCEVLGGFHGPPRRTWPADSNFADISDLVPRWQAAAGAGDLTALARLSSRAARRTLARRGPADDPTEALARDLGALGIVIAHTGSARGLIFAPGSVPATGAAQLRAAGLRQIVRFTAGGPA
ncbi:MULTISPECIES: hypothetical protein [Actibacterium]|uniref:Uncharacterized protein involved in propanediol utilization n=1 Tax=Actibacterium naphthalenivorans TaxID=1614693 RepID=A0A840CA82_9RHOB|nr:MULTISPECIES: hypothetical protein [Actibacterium]ALG91464.1 hypothetical protein TQ29_16285 [Actibacterium sp. EMB200-NS6]MBB4022901.1 uncharacterized protein involved in propanediol utilization [Actibacterium naphthalenivorans]